MNFFKAREDYSDLSRTDLFLLDTLSFNSHDSYPTLLMKAIITGNIPLARVLITNEIRINDKGDENATALTLAANGGYLDLVKLLLEKRVNIEEVGLCGHTALSLSSKRGFTDIVEFLLEQGANVNHETSNGSTPLMYASLYGHYDTIEEILASQPDVNVSNNEGATALIYAARYGHEKVVDLLVSWSLMNIDKVDNRNYSALMYACQHNHPNVVKMLLDAGADINLKAGCLFNRYNAFGLAKRRGNREVMEIFWERSRHHDDEEDCGNDSDSGKHTELEDVVDNNECGNEYCNNYSGKVKEI